MSSIFIWKTDQPLPPTCSTMRYYHGVDWCLQEDDNESYSCSFQYLAQEIYPEYSVYTVKQMRADWIGEDLLEVRNVPYHTLYSSNGIRIHQLGTWMQCIYPSDDLDTEATWQMIQKLLLDPRQEMVENIQIVDRPMDRPVDHNKLVRNQRDRYHRDPLRGRGGHGGRGGRGGRGRGSYGGEYRAIMRV
jgi:hypothetical protein